jgi:outer membrane protein insertion porin family
MEHTTNDSPPPQHTSIFRRWYFWVALTGVVLVTAVIVGGWYFYRSGRVNEYVARQIEMALQEYGVRAEVGGFEIGRGIRTATLRNVKFYNQATGQLIGTLDRAVVELSITDLYALNLRRNVVFQRLELEKLDLYVEIDENGKSNLDGLHQAPPRAPSRITFDVNSLVGELKNGKLHFNDKQRKIKAEMPQLAATFQPSRELGFASILTKFTALNNQINYEGRETTASKIEFDGNLLESGVEIKQIIVNSELGDVTASGRVNDWQALRYQLDTKVRAQLDEIARFASPDTKVNGEAEFIGQISGEGTNYLISGDASAPDFTAAGLRVRAASIQQIRIEPKENTINITTQRASVQSVIGREFQATSLTVPSVAAQINTNDASAIINAPAASAAQLRLTTTPAQVNAINLQNLQAKISEKEFNVQSNARINNASFENIKVGNTTGKLALTQTVFSLADFTTAIFGGTVKGTATVNYTGGASNLKANFAGLKTDQVVNTFAVKNVPLAGTIDGKVDINFPGTHAQLLSGNLNARFSGQTQNVPAGDIPVNGDVVATVQRGTFNFSQLQLNTDATTITANGTLAQNGNSNLAFVLNSTRAEQLLTIASAVPALQPIISEYEPNVSGNFNFTGNLQGNIADPSLSGNLTAEKIGIQNELLGSLSGQLVFSPAEIRFENALLTANNGGTVKLNYAAPRAETATSGTLDATFERINAEEIVKAAGFSLEQKLIAGELTGEARLTGLPAAPRGSVNVNLQNGTIAGQPAQLATANIIFDAQTARLERVEARLPQGNVTASGTYDLKTKNYQVQGEANEISLAKLVEAFEVKDTTVTGNADATFSASGNADDLNQLKVELAATGRQLTINGRNAGELKINARTATNGRIDAELVTNITGQPQPFTASIEIRQPGRPVQIATDLNNFDLGPLLAIFAPDATSSVRGNVTGRLRISGPLFDAKDNFSTDRLSGNLTLDTVALNVSGNAINIKTPVVVALDSSQIRLQPTQITGTGTNLSLGGTLGLREGQGLDFALNGRINLADFRPSPDMFMDGNIVIDARIGGTTSQPALSGQATLQNIAFTALDSPVNLESGNGRIVLAGNRITLENFSANANDGTLEIKGEATLDGLKPGEWRFDATAQDVNVLYAGARANANATLALRGTSDSQTLSGRVTLPLVEYTKDFGVDGAFGSTGNINFGNFGGDLTSTNASGASSLFPPINLNIRVDARDAILVRNEQVNTVASAVLTIGGTADEPDPSGRISFEGGTITFRKQRYEITAGTLDLNGGAADPPYLNLLAEGSVSGYQVSIGLTGPIDNLDVNLTSEPQLARAEILSLVTTGRTESNALTSNDLVRSGVGTAASLLTQEFISKPLQGETEKLLGLNLFQIDPVLRPNANPAARLTIGRQIAQGLSFTYSTNLASQQDQTAILEYNLTSRFSALASFTQGGSSTQQGNNDNDFTIEVRGRKRFALGAERQILSAAATRPAIIRPNITPRKLPTAAVDVNKPEAIKLNEKQLPELLPVIREGYSRALTRLGERNLTNYLQEQGYFFAEVTSRCQPENCEGPDLRIFYDVQPGERYELSNLRLTGTDQLNMSDVQSDLQSQESSLFGSVPYLKSLPLVGGLARGITSNDRLRNDAEIIRRRMIDLGFRGARVEARRAINPDNNDLVIIFNVTEGERSSIAEINTTGNTVLTAKELLQVVPQKQGEAFSPTDIRNGATQIRQAYSQRGYLEAKANIKVTDLPNNQVQLVYEITEGPQSVVQNIEVRGLAISREDSVRRFFDFKPGDVLTTQSIRRTQRDLYSTGAFSEVDIRPRPIRDGNNDSDRRVIVNLTEAKPLLLVYGLGFSTDEGPRALGQLTHTNLLGRLNAASLRLRVSRREQLAQLQYTDLRPFGTRWATTVSGFYNRNADLRAFVRKTVDQNADDQNNRGTTFGINRFASYIQTERKFSDITSIRFRYNYETAKLFNLQNVPDIEATRNEKAVRLGMFSAGISHDTRDNIINPTRGQLLSADHSIAATFFGGNESFNKFYGNYQYYNKLPGAVPLLKNSVFAFSARVGVASSFKITDRDGDGVITEPERRLPISERFFSGGATTLRGFQFEQAGPQGVLEPRNANELPTLVPLGGDALAIFNFELRYPFSRRFTLVPFYDLGNVFRKASDFRFSGMTNTVGFGIRFNTPVGPIGVDYGYLLDPPSFVTASGGVIRQKQGVIHIRFGQSF